MPEGFPYLMPQRRRSEFPLRGLPVPAAIAFLLADPTTQKEFIPYLARLHQQLRLKARKRLLNEDIGKAATYLWAVKRLQPKGISIDLRPDEKGRVPFLPQLYHTLQPYLSLLAHGDVPKKIRNILGDDIYPPDPQAMKLTELAMQQSGEAQILLSTKRLKLIRISSHAAARHYGRHTEWCTAWANYDHFDDYTERGSLFVLVDKKKTNTYQFHFRDFLLADANDVEINLADLVHLLALPKHQLTQLGHCLMTSALKDGDEFPYPDISQIRAIVPMTQEHSLAAVARARRQAVMYGDKEWEEYAGYEFTSELPYMSVEAQMQAMDMLHAALFNIDPKSFGDNVTEILKQTLSLLDVEAQLKAVNIFRQSVMQKKANRKRYRNNRSFGQKLGGILSRLDSTVHLPVVQSLSHLMSGHISDYKFFSPIVQNLVEQASELTPSAQLKIMDIAYWAEAEKYPEYYQDLVAIMGSCTWVSSLAAEAQSNAVDVVGKLIQRHDVNINFNLASGLIGRTEMLAPAAQASMIDLFGLLLDKDISEYIDFNAVHLSHIILDRLPYHIHEMSSDGQLAATALIDKIITGNPATGSYAGRYLRSIHKLDPEVQLRAMPGLMKLATKSDMDDLFRNKFVPYIDDMPTALQKSAWDIAAAAGVYLRPDRAGVRPAQQIDKRRPG